MVLFTWQSTIGLHFCECQVSFELTRLQLCLCLRFLSLNHKINNRIHFHKYHVLFKLTRPQLCPFFAGSSGDCELAIVLSPATSTRHIGPESDQREENFPPKVVSQLRPHLQPQSASAPCSPRLGLRRPQQQITITSSATLKVTNNSTPTRDRSKSPALNR